MFTLTRLFNRRITLTAATLLIALTLIADGTPVSKSSPPPPPQALNHYFGNLHSHTKYSDGSGTPDEAYKYARDVGDLDFLAITEHNHKDAEPTTGDRADNLLIATDATLYPKLKQAANSINENGRFVAIYGQEFSSISKGNHTNHFMADEVITTSNGDYKTIFTSQWMSDHQVEVIQLNHPWDGKKRSNKQKNITISDIGTSEDNNYGFNDFSSQAAFVRALDGKATLIEVINGPALTNPELDDDGNPLVYLAAEADDTYYFKYLNMGLHLAPTGDQDNHYLTWGTITETRTVVLAPSLTRENIIQAMQERRVYATEDKDLKVTFTVNNKVMGSINPRLQTGSTATIRVGVSDTDEPNSRYRWNSIMTAGREGMRRGLFRPRK
jgi:hypothetical protein